MSNLKKNVVSNYLGQGWTTLMNLAFVPLYIKYMGIETYGLIGIFALLQAGLALLDMGMTPTLSREMARFTGGDHDAQSIRDLLRSIEIIGLGIAVLVTLGTWAASDWLASDWLRAGRLPVEEVSRALAIMGAVSAMRFVENIYRSSIVGLQRQVLLNVVTGVMATLRGLGSVGILVWVSPTITAFFIWQGLVSLFTVGLFSVVVYRTLPALGRHARFSLDSLIAIWRFAAGMMTITLLAILLTQVDKVLLSRLLTLKTFGYYTLAGVVANTLYTLTLPITSAFYPQFTVLVTRAEEVALIRAYHKSAQLVTVLMGTAAIILIVFGDVVMALWTRDSVIVQEVAPLVAVLALGTLLNGLMWIPHQMQLAHGWTGLTVKVNIVAVAVLVPAILGVAPVYGAIGASWVWVALNVGYLLFEIYFMHRRLLRTEKWRWYQQDVAVPLGAGAATAGLLRWAMPAHHSIPAQLAGLVFSAGLVLAASALVAPAVRHQLAHYMPERMRSMWAKTLGYYG
jgi:O-antigen/teichoic acid export membrane protein